MDDVVYRELFILKANCIQMAKTIRLLSEGLRNDVRFARLEPVKDMRPDELQLELIKKAGPEDLTDPFSKPLNDSHD